MTTKLREPAARTTPARFLTRRRYTVHFTTEQVGQKPHYLARWQTATGETGPWSQVASMVIAG